MNKPKTNYIVFDFETTGFSPTDSQVIQISAGLVVNNEILLFNQFIECQTLLPGNIIELTGITNEILCFEGINEKLVWTAFRNFIDDLPLIGHNSVKFDRLFLEHFFKKYDLELPNHDRYIDTGMIFKAELLKEKQLSNETYFDYMVRIGDIKAYGVKYNLALCCEHYKIDTTKYQAHQADSDVLMTWEIYKKILESKKQDENS